jgi:hypothetical protein
MTRDTCQRCLDTSHEWAVLITSSGPETAGAIFTPKREFPPHPLQIFLHSTGVQCVGLTKKAA